MASCFGRTSPDPRLGPAVELRRGHSRCLFNLISISKTLPSERITAEEPPPALLQVEPARPFGNEHLLDARMAGQPGTALGAVVAIEIVSDHVEVAGGIGRFNVSKQGNIAFRVA
jgi:hypothetical protein